MSLVLFCGDWHGSTPHARMALDLAAEKHCSAVIQLGDFGLWPTPKGERYLEEVKDAAAKYKMRLYWLAGNHEWWDEIDRWMAEVTWPIAQARPVPLSEYVSYLPNGSRFRLDGVRYGVLGGAYSIDQQYRTPGMSWWPQEEPTMEDVDRLGDGALDILLTHDAPALPPGHVAWLPESKERAAEHTRHLIREALENTAPRTLFHGHWHHRYDSSWKGTTIYGLASDEQPFNENVLLFDAKRHRVIQ